MNRKQNLRIRTVGVPVVASLVVAVAWTQMVGAQTPARRVEREIEIMSGILETTLRFAIEESSALTDGYRSAKERNAYAQLVYVGRNRPTSVSGYYLEDQGVAFVIKTGGVANRGLVDPSTGESKFKLRDVLIHGSLDVKQVQVDVEERLEKRQAAVKERIERMQARTDTLKNHLVEALANHGDSMTILGEDEYLNLILEPDSSSGLLTGVVFGVPTPSSAARTETLTVRKSWITDYKAGRLSLEEFKQEVLEY